MPKRSLKLPRGPESFSTLSPFSEDDWQRVEHAFGKELSDEVREAIFRATELYVLASQTESSAESIRDAKKRIEALRKTAADFQSLMMSSMPSYAELLITGHFQDSRLSDKVGGLYVGRCRSLNGVLASFDVACRMALNDLAPSSTGVLAGVEEALPYWQEGAAWKNWVRQLAEIMRDDRLPHTVRKDTGSKSKSEKQSPFVCLVWELQRSLPDGCARHTHSMAGLADAIAEARKSGVKRPRATPE